MKRTVLFALMILTLLLAACAPQPAAPTAEPVEPTVQAAAPTAVPTQAGITLTDSMQRTVTLKAPAQKVVTLAPSNTEILFALGAGAQLVARDDFSDFPEAAKALPSVGGSQSGYNLEEITRLQPDLILAAGINTPEQVKALENLGMAVYFLDNPTDLAGMYANLQTVGKLVGREKEAADLVAQLTQRVDRAMAVVKQAKSTPKVFYELDATDPAKPWTAGPGTFVDYLITQAGAENVGAKLGSSWAQLSQEELIVQDPDFILLGDNTFGGVTPDQVKARAGWQQLSAVKEDRVLIFDDNTVSRPGPRMVDGLEALVRALHPELADQLK